jgi:hypothetical protein
MSAQTEPETPASEVLSRALEVWAKGYQVIPLGLNESSESLDLDDWQQWIRQRQTREDVERLFTTGPPAADFGIIECSSAWWPRVADDDDGLWSALLSEDVVRTKVDLGRGEVVEWLFTGKFQFFEQLENLRKNAEAKAQEAEVNREKSKESLLQTPITRVGPGDLKNLFSNPAVIRKIARVLGIPERRREHGGFLCVLHAEQHPSAHLFQNDGGPFIYSCFHGSDDLWVRPLPEVYYVLKTGNTGEKMKGPTFATWALRLLAEAGVLQPLDDVGLPELKVASEGERKVYERLKLLFSLRWTYSPGEPAPFSWRFAEDWCGVAQATAGKAIQKFLKLGIVHSAGKYKNTTLFLPGKGKRVIRIRLVGRKGERKSRL